MNQDFKGIKAAAYIRLSKEDGDKIESNSVANQRELINNFVKSSKDIVIYQYYIDDGYTGADFNRPDFQKMMQDIQRGKINCVIVKDLSRLGRNYIDAGQYMERIFPKHKVRFIAINDNIDNFNQRYDISVPIKNIVNAQYAEDISKKVISSLHTKQKEGKFIGAFASYGYIKDPTDKNKLIIDEQAADVVKSIYNMYISGTGIQTIARTLNSKEIPCPSEYKRLNGLKYKNSNRIDFTTYWTYSTVHHILMNRLYIGDMVQHKSNCSRYNFMDKTVPKDEWIIVENTHKAIISKEIWQTTQDFLKKKYKSTSLKTPHMFAGIVKCKECNRGMTKLKTSDQNEMLVCGTYKRLGAKICTRHEISITDLSNIVSNAINRHINELCDAKKIVFEQEVSKQKKLALKKQLKTLENIIAEKKQRKLGLYEDYRDKLITKEEFVEYGNNYLDEIKKLMHNIDALNKEINLNPQKNDGEEWLKRMTNNKNNLDLNRELILTFIDVIYVTGTNMDDRTVEIYFNFQK